MIKYFHPAFHLPILSSTNCCEQVMVAALLPRQQGCGFPEQLQVKVQSLSGRTTY